MTTQLAHDGSQARMTGLAAAAGRGRIRAALHRVHLAVQDMNYASRRLVEVPWTVDSQWHRK